VPPTATLPFCPFSPTSLSPSPHLLPLQLFDGVGLRVSTSSPSHTSVSPHPPLVCARLSGGQLCSQDTLHVGRHPRRTHGVPWTQRRVCRRGCPALSVLCGVVWVNPRAQGDLALVVRGLQGVAQVCYPRPEPSRLPGERAHVRPGDGDLGRGPLQGLLRSHWQVQDRA
jgi:hypothetical protein